MTVTIGIAAYNEEKGIERVLHQILAQETSFCKIDKIILRCDGCTDNTARNALRVIDDSSIITLINDKNRIGLAESLNTICQKNQSDILIFLDADCTIDDNFIIEKIATKFSDPEIGIVSGNALPIRGSGIIQKIAYEWIMCWYSCRKSYLSGDNVNNHFGVVSAISKNLAKNMIIPSNLVGVPDYVYFFGKSLGYKYVFVEQAKVFYRPAATIKDYLYQTARHHGSKDQIIKIFGEGIVNSYVIPKDIKRRAMVTSLFSSPILFPLACLLQIYLRIFQQVYNKNYNNGLWDIIPTTK